MSLGLSFLFSVCTPTATTARDLPQYEINLDLPPGTRYAGLFTVPDTNFNETVWKFYNDNFANDALLTDVLYKISQKRGNENEEQQAEIEGLADMSKVRKDRRKSKEECRQCVQSLRCVCTSFTVIY